PATATTESYPLSLHDALPISPLAFAGSARYSVDWLEIVERLPEIDAVLLTHDHYDHLDYGSIRALESKVGHFFVPLGVGAHLERSEEHTSELQSRENLVCRLL